MKTQATTTKPDAGQLNLFACTGNNNRKRYQRTEKTKVAPTSIAAYYEERATGTFQTIGQQIFQQLNKGKAMTRRQLSKAIGKDASSLCAALKALQKIGLVIVAYDDKCPTTGKLVSWFALSRTPSVESFTKPIEP